MIEKRRKLKEQTMMKTAELWSKLSTCSRLKVGAVICQPDFSNIFAIGINGGISGQSNECESSEPGKCGHYHAELNAITKPQWPAPEKYLFVTHLPCKTCAGLIVNTKVITRVYYKEDYRIKDAIEVFETAGIEVIHLSKQKKISRPLPGQKDLFEGI